LSVSSAESFVGRPILHLDSISFPYSATYTLRVRLDEGNDAGFEREFPFDANRSRGCAFTVESTGNYSIFFSSVSPESNGQLDHDGLASFSVSGAYDNFYPSVSASFRTESAHPTETIRESGSSGKGNDMNSTLIIISVIIGVAVLAASVVCVVIWYRNHQRLKEGVYDGVRESSLEASI
jgi:hypothetical protein